MVCRILVVDDESSANFMIKQIFRREIKAGTYELFFAANGLEALDLMARQPLEMVLSDINMPEMDGLKLLEQIYHIYPEVRVIMLSAYSDLRRVRHAMNYGAFDYLTKPVEATDLRETVHKLVGFIAEGKERNKA